MLTVTEGAAARLAEILVDEAAPAEVVVRLFISGKQLAMKLDTERGGDTTVEYRRPDGPGARWRSRGAAVR